MAFRFAGRLSTFWYAVAMKTKPFYLVINTDSRTVVRTRQSWPQLEPGEIIVRLVLEVPDELIPKAVEIVIEDIDAIGVAVEPVAL